MGLRNPGHISRKHGKFSKLSKRGYPSLLQLGKSGAGLHFPNPTADDKGGIDLFIIYRR